MKAGVLRRMLNDGKKPLVKLTGQLWDDSFGCEGMVARMTAVSEEPMHGDEKPLFDYRFDYNEHAVQNFALDKPEWYLKGGDEKGTAVQAGIVEACDLFETVLFSDDEDVAAELCEGEGLADEYVHSRDASSMTYVQWLERKLEELVPEDRKTWKRGKPA